ncbi:baseplate J/gp47 family protein [Desulforamulus ruminis]|uniref:baseplate J/gp47 family protein n=1 Tax=Desulforamulus ruminis TaxID=1564 RepID=UPI002355F5BE|nr:baseplate J/gp47 family protein [Desulforamulus ruminis]
MYEQQTYDAILKRVLDRVPGNVDKREGSIIYDALAPAAIELTQMYAELEANLTLSYADTATGEYLERRTAEFGVNRQPATKARRKGLFYGSGDVPMDIPLNSRFSIGDLNYAAVSKLATGQYVMECEVTGAVGNQQFGALLPIDYISGLARAELADILVPGEDAETDDSLRTRFFAAVNEQPFGGNIADYRQKITGIEGIGGVKIFPTWQGGGTVKCTLIAADFSPPTPELIEEVQTIIDPEVNQGEGIGLAPIGHTVTIAGVESVEIDMETTVTLAGGMTLGQVQGEIESTFQDYLLTLRQAWAGEEKTVVRTAQIDARILAISGIVDVQNTKLNGATANIELGEEEIPVPGEVVVNE